jgi:hypothetical protein
MTTPDDPSLYCRSCKYALAVWGIPLGATRLVHALDIDAISGHVPDPVPLVSRHRTGRCAVAGWSSASFANRRPSATHRG